MDGKIYRLTFSKSLAEHIAGIYKNSTITINRRTFRTGRRLQPGEKSNSGLYAIVDTRKDITLRITLFPEIAELFRSDSRYIAEAWIVR